MVYIDHFAPSFLTNVFSITLAYYILYLTLKLNGHGYFSGLWKMRTKKKSMTKINSEKKAGNELESEWKYLL